MSLDKDFLLIEARPAGEMGDGESSAVMQPLAAAHPYYPPSLEKYSVSGRLQGKVPVKISNESA